MIFLWEFVAKKHGLMQVDSLGLRRALFCQCLLQKTRAGCHETTSSNSVFPIFFTHDLLPNLLLWRSHQYSAFLPMPCRQWTPSFPLPQPVMLEAPAIPTLTHLCPFTLEVVHSPYFFPTVGSCDGKSRVIQEPVRKDAVSFERLKSNPCR